MFTYLKVFASEKAHVHLIGKHCTHTMLSNNYLISSPILTVPMSLITNVPTDYYPKKDKQSQCKLFKLGSNNQYLIHQPERNCLVTN